MVFVSLGTQDKEFRRLLEMVDNLINDGIIQDKVIAQVGCTKYQSNNIKIYDYLDQDSFKKHIKDAKYVIIHGGVGSIFDCLNLGKKVIAVPRLSRYGEHHNDHQLQVVSEFSRDGYILDGSNLSEAVKKIDKFEPKKYESNNANFINIITNYIDKN